MRTPLVPIAVLTLTGFAAPAPAQSAPGAAPPAGADALRGPSVRSEPAVQTIVERDAAGRVKRLDSSPEEAAIARLTLDDATRANVDHLVHEREAAMDKAVRENLDLLMELHAAASGGDKRGAITILWTLIQRAPVVGQGALFRASLMEALPAQQREQAQGMVNAYRDAVRQELEAEASRDGAPSLRELAGKERADALGRELHRATYRIIDFGRARLEETIALVGATPEQEARIRAIATEWGQRTKLNPTPEDERELRREIAAVLTPEQVAKYVAARKAGATADDGAQPAPSPPSVVPTPAAATGPDGAPSSHG